MKKTKRDIPRPYNAGTMTEAERHSLIVSALRNASRWWKPKDVALKRARVGIGRYKCELCGEIVPLSLPPKPGNKRRIKAIQADHILGCVPLTGWDSWDGFIERMFCEADGFQAICHVCHHKKTQEERSERRLHNNMDEHEA